MIPYIPRIPGSPSIPGRPETHAHKSCTPGSTQIQTGRQAYTQDKHRQQYSQREHKIGNRKYIQGHTSRELQKVHTSNTTKNAYMHTSCKIADREYMHASKRHTYKYMQTGYTYSPRRGYRQYNQGTHTNKGAYMT